MTQPLIKICGVRSPEIARVVSENGADLMGLIFAPSRRQVSEEQAQQIVAPLHETGEERPRVVGVFVNERAETMNRLADSVGLDFVQLSGDEAPEAHGDISREVIRALRLPAGMSIDEARREVERYLDCAVPAWALLLDTHVNGSYGGNGIQGDWEIARLLAERYPIILAGGLRPESVAGALRTLQSFGVDVSSGVETGGTKDPEKIREFIRAARGVTIENTARAVLHVGSSNG